MQISIVTISFNQVQYLKKCIDSVLSQNIQPLDYIIIDPGSTDGSRELIASYGNKIRAIFEPDSGPADGLNRGFSIARGDVYGFINSDDYLLPGCLEKIVAYYSGTGLNSFVTGYGLVTSGLGLTETIKPSKLTKFKMAYGGATIFQQGTFFPADYFKSVNGFNKENFTCWDGELFSEFIIRGYSHTVLRKQVAVFRIHSNSITGKSDNRNNYIKDRNRIFKKLMGRNFSTVDYLISIIVRTVKYAGKKFI